MLIPPLSDESLRALFTKPYGSPGPTVEQWKAVYAENVVFVDPTQTQAGIDAYIKAQDNLLRRCDDTFLEPLSISQTGNIAFVEWTMGLKIKGIEFIYPGTTRLQFDASGLIINHRDYFDFILPTFGPVPLLGGFTRWLYGRFIA
ncbi:MAG: nuclear transport factor 2 family protein [Synechococcus sp.]